MWYQRWVSVPLAIFLGAAWAPAQGQVGTQGWIDILEPVEWAGEATRGLTVRQRTSIRIVGRAGHPSGIQRVLINGLRAGLSPESSGAVTFTGSVPVAAGLERVEIRAEATDGRSITRVFDVQPLPPRSSDDPSGAFEAESAGDRWAVVVGISDYRDSDIVPLAYADDDARSFRDFLVSDAAGLGGFNPENVILLLNDAATTFNIRTALREWLGRATEDDLVVIYFAGHGAPHPTRPDELYLLTHDTEAGNLAGSAFPMEDVQEVIGRLDARHILVFTDACHSAGVGGQVGRRAGADNRINAIFRDQLHATSTTEFVFTASEVNQLSQEGTRWGGGHGVFTWALMEALAGEADLDEDRIVRLGEMMEWTRDRVQDETLNAQSPSFNQGAFDRMLPLAIVPAPGRAAPPGSIPPLPPLPDIFQLPSEERSPRPPSAAPAAAPSGEETAGEATAFLDPTSAAVRSLFVPGLGQMYTGRTALGAAFMGAAGGVLAFGALATKRTVECFSPLVEEVCPENQIRGEVVERPYLMPSLGAALALSLGAAFEAFRAAKRLNERARGGTRSGEPDSGLRLALPGLEVRSGVVRFHLLRLTF